MNQYNKFIIAGIGGIISGLLLYFGQDIPQWVNLIVYVATALGVYQVPNKA